MYRLELRTQVSQGDIFDDLPYVRVQHPDLQPVVKNARAVILTHDCEFDKANSTTILIAAVRSLASQSRGYQEAIRSERVLSAFYLEAQEAVIPESYIDLRTITVIDRQIVLDRAAEGKRLVSITYETRLALQGQLTFFFGREVPGDE